MRRQNSTDGTISHTPKQTHPRTVAGPRIHVFESFGPGNDGYDQDCLADHPQDKLAPFQECQQLIEIVGGFSDGSKYCY